MCVWLFGEGVSYLLVSIGWVVISEVFRGKGVGRVFMCEVIDYCEVLWLGCDIEIGV